MHCKIHILNINCLVIILIFVIILLIIIIVVVIIVVILWFCLLGSGPAWATLPTSITLP